jgi:hypothetical protein
MVAGVTAATLDANHGLAFTALAAISVLQFIRCDEVLMHTINTQS